MLPGILQVRLFYRSGCFADPAISPIPLFYRSSCFTDPADLIAYTILQEYPFKYDSRKESRRQHGSCRIPLFEMHRFHTCL